MNEIEKVVINNYKCFKGQFSINLNPGTNVIVGNNESGKSTILEAIHLALSGLLNGKYLRNELTQYIFNKEVEREYLESLNNQIPQYPPSIEIELHFSGNDLPEFEGDGSSSKTKGCGISYKIEFDSQYQDEYDELIKSQLTTIPVEYYKITLTSFARERLYIKSIPVKSVLIDSTSTKFQNGSDMYISKIIKDDLDEKETVDLSQAYRKLKEMFMADKSVQAINKKITGGTGISDKDITISVDLSARNSWETSLMTYVDDIPFHQIGKGEQCLIKTNLALEHKKTTDSNLILIEEPENHLSYSKLNQFIKTINDKCKGKQIIITTHSSFVANKLNLKNLTLLNSNQEKFNLRNLSDDTFDFFAKLPGYETLRIILCKKAILVEGPSDELIIQRAYMDKNGGVLPIENGIDVISVGLTFKRFLKIAEKINKKIAVITDNDGDYKSKIRTKYKDFAESQSIKIFADNKNELNTLEPQLVNENEADLNILCDVIGLEQNYCNKKDLVAYMTNNKTDCALKIFNSNHSISYPNYINEAINWSNE